MSKHTVVAAADQDDLAALSALLQDMVVKVSDMAHLPQERRFALVGNRYRWEAGKRGPGERVRCGVHFGDVVGVKTKGIRLEAGDAVLSLLDVSWEGGEAGGTLLLTFAGGGAIKLEAEAINAELRDLSGPWRAVRRPNHDGA